MFAFLKDVSDVVVLFLLRYVSIRIIVAFECIVTLSKNKPPIYKLYCTYILVHGQSYLKHKLKEEERKLYRSVFPQGKGKNQTWKGKALWSVYIKFNFFYILFNFWCKNISYRMHCSHVFTILYDLFIYIFL